MRLDWHQERISPSAETKCSAPCDVGEATSVGCAVGAEGALYGLRESSEDWTRHRNQCLRKARWHCLAQGQRLEQLAEANVWKVVDSEDKVKAYLGTYVDDLVAVGPTEGVEALLGEVRGERVGMLGKPGAEVLWVPGAPYCWDTEAYADASFAPAMENYKSVHGTIVMAAGCPLLWSSSRQPFITGSTADAELVAYTEVFQQAEGVASLLEAMGIEDVKRTLYGDNKSALSLCQGDVGAWRTLRLRLRAAGLRAAMNCEVSGWSTHHVRGAELPADGLTKQLMGAAFDAFVRQVGVGRPDKTHAEPGMKMVQRLDEQQRNPDRESGKMNHPRGVQRPRLETRSRGHRMNPRLRNKKRKELPTMNLPRGSLL